MKIFILFQCVAEALVQQGVRKAVAQCIPGSELLFDVAKNAADKYRQRVNQAQMREELGQIAQASLEDVQAMADAVAAAQTPCDAYEQKVLATYLAQIQGSIRQSQKRKEDPTGRTIAANFALNEAADMARLLPIGLPRFLPGDELPGLEEWRLTRLLGVGGFGEVWLARHETFSNLPPGAVKFCRAGDLQHEAALINRVMGNKHAHIVGLTHARMKSDPPWLMYDYIEGGDLGDLIHRWSGLPMLERQAKVLDALRTLTGAVGYFHGLNPPIVHRDLKPANILRDHNDRLYITDFGIGGLAAQRSIKAQSTTTRVGKLQSALYGSHTPLYASSQQQAGTQPDPRDDVHALGVIGYQLLTGQMAQGVGSDLVEDLQELGVVQGLIDVLKQCTAQKLERRLAHAGVVWHALQALGNGPPQEKSSKTPASPIASSPSQAVAAAAPTDANQILTFEAVFVDTKGTVIRKQPGTARYFTEPLKELKAGAKPLDMLWVPPGTFQMGGTDEELQEILRLVKQYGWDEANNRKWFGWSVPRHPVTIPEGFYMSRYPVTQAQYAAVMDGADPAYFKGANRPVEQVRWYDAKEFCKRLSALSGKEYGLPSEAQWEYACRAGTTTPFHYGETITAEVANYDANYIYGSGPKGKYREETTEVGSFPPNGFGLYDMHGNVWEWCQDGWHGNYEGAPPDGFAWESGDSGPRVLRGGSWNDLPHFCRAADRNDLTPDNRYGDYGFRVVRVVPART